MTQALPFILRIFLYFINVDLKSLARKQPSVVTENSQDATFYGDCVLTGCLGRR